MNKLCLAVRPVFFYASVITIVLITTVSLGLVLNYLRDTLVGEPLNCDDFGDIENFPDSAHHNHHYYSKNNMNLSPQQIRIKTHFHQQQMKRQVITSDRTGKNFFQRNWEPSYSCTAMARMGCPGDGGKWVCDPHLYLVGNSHSSSSSSSSSSSNNNNAQQQQQCVIYSIGSNNEFSFEKAIHHYNPLCQIHTFDSTMPVYPGQKPHYVKFHPWSLGGHDDAAGWTFTLSTMMRKLGHQNITILKVDCEGCELDSFGSEPSSFPAGRGAIQQILVEVHFDGRPERVHDFFRFLSKNGYAIVSKEPNIMYTGGNAVEFSFLHIG